MRGGQSAYIAAGVVLLALIFVLMIAYVPGGSPWAAASDEGGNGGWGVSVSAHAASGPPVPSGCGSIVREYTVTITNYNTTAATGTYAQNLTFNPSLFTGFTATLSNLALEYSNGTLVQTWIQDNPSSSSTATDLWLHLFSISASTAQTLYLLACANSMLGISGPTGEAPILSGTYGQYDNGRLVFSLYDNFSGSVINAGIWSAFGVGAPSYVVNNGFTLTKVAQTNGAGFKSSATFSAPFQMTWYGNETRNFGSSAPLAFTGLGSEARTGTGSANFIGMVYGLNGGSADNYASYQFSGTGCTQQPTPVPPTGFTTERFKFSNNWYNQSNNDSSILSNSPVTCGGHSLTQPTNVVLSEVGGGGGTPANALTTYWIAASKAQVVLVGVGLNNPPGAPTGTSATAGSSSQVNIAWTNPSGSLIANQVYVFSGSSCGGSPTEEFLGGVYTTYAATGLSGATAYSFEVTANTSGSEGPPSACFAGTTLPSAPTGLTAKTVNAGEIDLNWVNPSGSLTDSHVYVYAGFCYSFSPVVHNVGSVVTSLGLTGLPPGKTFCFAVSANSTGGESALSATATNQTQSNQGGGGCTSNCQPPPIFAIPGVPASLNWFWVIGAAVLVTGIAVAFTIRRYWWIGAAVSIVGVVIIFA